MNQDCLENFFSIIRGKGGFRDNPNTVQFGSAFRDACVDTIFVKAKNSNCEGDLDSFVLTYSIFKQLEDRKQLNTKGKSSSTECHTSDVQDAIKINLCEVNALVYIAGYLLRKAKSRFNCENCWCLLVCSSQNFISSSVVTFLCHKKYDQSSHLIIPSESLVKFLESCHKIFESRFDHVIHTEKPRLKLLNCVKNSCDLNNVYCGNESCVSLIDYIVQLYFTVKISSDLKRYNQSLTVAGLPKNRKILKLQHR